MKIAIITLSILLVISFTFNLYQDSILDEHSEVTAEYEKEINRLSMHVKFFQQRYLNNEKLLLRNYFADKIFKKHYDQVMSDNNRVYKEIFELKKDAAQHNDKH